MNFVTWLSLKVKINLSCARGQSIYTDFVKWSHDVAHPQLEGLLCYYDLLGSLS